MSFQSILLFRNGHGDPDRRRCRVSRPSEVGSVQPSAGALKSLPTCPAAAARGLGWRAWRIERDDELKPRLAEAFGGAGPALLDVTVDPSGYAAQLRALRG